MLFPEMVFPYTKLYSSRPNKVASTCPKQIHENHDIASNAFSLKKKHKNRFFQAKKNSLLMGRCHFEDILKKLYVQKKRV